MRSMAIGFSFQRPLYFSVAHVLIDRGLVKSNALTGSVISLSMSAVVGGALCFSLYRCWLYAMQWR